MADAEPTAEPNDLPSLIAFVETSTRAYRDWSPALLRAAEIEADGGRLSMAADLCETMFGDDRLRAVLDTRTDGLLALPLSFDGDGPARSGLATKALNVEEDWWASFPETELKLLHAWGIMLGVGLAEIVWVERGDRVIPKLTIWHPRALRWDTEKRRWLLTVDNPRRELEITPGDGKWILYMPYGSHRPWSHGAYRSLSRWSLLKRYSIPDWGGYGERHGSAILSVTGAEGTREQRREIASDLQQLGRNGAIVLPKGFVMQLHEATARSWETFKAQIECADNGTAVAILGQNLSTQAGSGTQGVATLHGRVALGRTKADNETLSTTLHDQALTWWAEFNFGDRNAAPWPVWDTTPTEDLKEKAGMLQMVSQAVSALISAGAPVDIRALCDDFDIPLIAESGDDKAKGALFQYHFVYGVVTKNEARARLGLPAVAGGDVPPKPVAADTPANDVTPPAAAAPAPTNGAAPPTGIQIIS